MNFHQIRRCDPRQQAHLEQRNTYERGMTAITILFGIADLETAWDAVSAMCYKEVNSL
jgi:hypothetical protein